MYFVPKKVFLTKGIGRHREKLVSFEMALRSAGIQFLNYVQVSSIFPPQAQLVSREEGLKIIRPGQVSFIVMSRNQTDEPHRLIACSVGLALPSDKSAYGYLSEHHAEGVTGEECGEYAEDLAAQMLATTLGVEFDEDSGWDDRQQIWKMSDKIVKTTNVTQSGVGQRNIWTTVVAAAVLILEEPNEVQQRVEKETNS